MRPVIYLSNDGGILERVANGAETEEDALSFQDYSESASCRLRLGTVSSKLLVGAVAIVVIVLAIIAFTVFGSTGGDAGFSIEREGSSSALSEAPAASSSAGAAATVPAEVCVHVGGCVNAPGVYRLKEGDRVADAVASAGGMTPEAASDAVNLARVLVDGEQIIVPDASAPEGQAAGDVLGGGASSGGSPGTAQASSKVNINTATSQELQTISGIGEAKAEKIIDYREKNGPFKTVDELTNVSGIGEKTLESLRDQICV